MFSFIIKKVKEKDIERRLTGIGTIFLKEIANYYVQDYEYHQNLKREEERIESIKRIEEETNHYEDKEFFNEDFMTLWNEFTLKKSTAADNCLFIKKMNLEVAANALYQLDTINIANSTSYSIEYCLVLALKSVDTDEILANAIRYLNPYDDFTQLDINGIFSRDHIDEIIRLAIDIKEQLLEGKNPFEEQVG